MAQPKFIEIFHNNPSITTIEGFINFHFIFGISAEELLNFEDNATAIKSSYFPTDGDVALTSLLRPGTLIKVPTENIDREIIATSTNITYNKNFNAFLGEKMKEVVEDTGYIPKVTNKQGVQALGEFYRLYNNITVWAWCKGLGVDEDGLLINITAFIHSLSTSVSKTGASFHLELSPILGLYDEAKGWIIDDDTMTTFVDSVGINNLAARSNVNYTIENTEFKRPNFFFEKILQSNDVIFIKFEPLEMEDADEINNTSDITNKFIISPNKLHTRVWDMIGLVDTVGIDTIMQNSEVKIDVVGRDLTKVLQEDGVYFFPLDYARNENEYFENTVESPKDNNAVTRLISGELFFFNAYLDRTIDFSIKFIFNLLSNIRVCSDEIFRYYPDPTYRYEFYTPSGRVVEDTIDDATIDVQNKIKRRNDVDEGQRKQELQKIKAPGIWKIIKLVFDEEVQSRRIVDSSITTAQGNLMTFINKVCQAPFVEFWGDTYGANYFFMTRKPPFSKKAYLSNFTIDVYDDEVYQENLNMDDSEVYSWYRIVPRGNFFGSDEISLIDFPAVYLKEYMEIWGSRPMEVVSNYVNYDGIAQSTAGQSLEDLRLQALQDLQFMIVTTAYLPFTRKGTLAIKGNRRIKVGMNIRYRPTGEIFHVTSVKNNFSVNRGSNDRLTVLTVERGMVEKYINDKEINYFNLIEFTDNKKDGSAETYNFKVNLDVFNFFLKKKQFAVK